MSGNLRLDVVTPKGRVFSSDVSEIQFPSASRGCYGILPGHTPVLTPLGDGLLTCLAEGRATTLTVFGGFAEAGPGHVTILARESETADSLDENEINEKLRRAENSYRDAKTFEEQLEHRAAIDACNLRLRALGSKGHGERD